MNIGKYINQIEQLEPLTTGFEYNIHTWQKLSSEHKAVVFGFEGMQVLRHDVIKAYADYYSGENDFLKAFLLTMIWGFENTGYGTHRTNKYISTPANIELIRQSIDYAGENNLKLAFNLLMRINGLGVSYISKVLYFATRAAGIKEYALVFDNRVAQSLVRLFANNDIYEIVRVNPSSKFDDYAKYNLLIHRLSKQYGVEAEAIELFLYEQKFL